MDGTSALSFPPAEIMPNAERETQKADVVPSLQDRVPPASISKVRSLPATRCNEAESRIHSKAWIPSQPSWMSTVAETQPLLVRERTDARWTKLESQNNVSWGVEVALSILGPLRTSQQRNVGQKSPAERARGSQPRNASRVLQPEPMEGQYPTAASGLGLQGVGRY